MKRLTSIVAVNEQGVIGAGNSLPWRVKSDLRFFRETTIGHIVIMGRKTYDSLGGSLKDRLNVVVTHGFGLRAPEANCFHAYGIVEALAHASTKVKRGQEVFVVGGASMYEQFSPFVDRYLITEIEKHVPNGDTFLDPDIVGDISEWDRKTILEGKANSQGDEADFRVFELTAHAPMVFSARRKAEVAAYRSRSHLKKGRKPFDSTVALASP